MKNNNSKKVLKVVGVLILVVLSVVYMGLKFYELEKGLHFMDSATCLFAAIAIFSSVAIMKKEKKVSLEHAAENV